MINVTEEQNQNLDNKMHEIKIDFSIGIEALAVVKKNTQLRPRLENSTITFYQRPRWEDTWNKIVDQLICNSELSNVKYLRNDTVSKSYFSQGLSMNYEFYYPIDSGKIITFELHVKFREFFDSVPMLFNKLNDYKNLDIEKEINANCIWNGLFYIIYIKNDENFSIPEKQFLSNWFSYYGPRHKLDTIFRKVTIDNVKIFTISPTVLVVHEKISLSANESIENKLFNFIDNNFFTIFDWLDEGNYCSSIVDKYTSNIYQLVELFNKWNTKKVYNFKGRLRSKINTLLTENFFLLFEYKNIINKWNKNNEEIKKIKTNNLYFYKAFDHASTWFYNIQRTKLTDYNDFTNLVVSTIQHSEDLWYAFIGIIIGLLSSNKLIVLSKIKF